LDKRNKYAILFRIHNAKKQETPSHANIKINSTKQSFNSVYKALTSIDHIWGLDSRLKKV